MPVSLRSEVERWQQRIKAPPQLSADATAGARRPGATRRGRPSAPKCGRVKEAKVSRTAALLRNRMTMPGTRSERF
jgi:hypothetical protein